MKTLLIFLLFFLSTAASVLAVEDTLIVVLKDGRTDFIPISKIERIVFGNITSIGANDSSESELSILGTYPNPFTDFTEIKFISRSSEITWLIILDNA
jgi:hypothetical protein